MDASMPLEVLCNPECAHCLHALDDITTMAVAAGVPVAGIDVRHHPEWAGGWEHSPVVKYGDREFPGIPSAAQFAALIAAKDI